MPLGLGLSLSRSAVATPVAATTVLLGGTWAAVSGETLTRGDTGTIAWGKSFWSTDGNAEAPVSGTWIILESGLTSGQWVISVYTDGSAGDWKSSDFPHATPFTATFNYSGPAPGVPTVTIVS